MKRLFFGMLFCVGLLVTGATNASAAVLCSEDPTVSTGSPVPITVSFTVSTGPISHTIYGSSTSTQTSGGFVLSKN